MCLNLHLIVQQGESILESLHYFRILRQMSNQTLFSFSSPMDKKELTMLFFVFHSDFGILNVLHLGLEPVED